MARSALVELVNGFVYIYKGIRFEKDIPKAVEPEMAQYLEEIYHVESFKSGNGKIAIQKFAVEYLTEKEALAIEQEVQSELDAQRASTAKANIVNTIKAISSRAMKELPSEVQNVAAVKRAESSRKTRGPSKEVLAPQNPSTDDTTNPGSTNPPINN